jgi:hypothetical protein
MASSHQQAWQAFCANSSQDVYMSAYQASGSYLEQQELFVAFAKWLQAGGSNNGRPISSTQVETTL